MKVPSSVPLSPSYVWSGLMQLFSNKRLLLIKIVLLIPKVMPKVIKMPWDPLDNHFWASRSDPLSFHVFKHQIHVRSKPFCSMVV